MFLVIMRRQNILLTLVLCTAEFFWKCSYLFWRWCSYCSQYCYVNLSFSENILIYSEETVHTAHIPTTYIRVLMKMILHGVAIMKPGFFYYSFPATSMTKRVIGHWPVDFPYRHTKFHSRASVSLAVTIVRSGSCVWTPSE